MSGRCQHVDGRGQCSSRAKYDTWPERCAVHARTPIQSFWDRVEKGGGCWLWKGGTRRRGYGALKHNGKMVSAHRLSYTERYGAIPPGAYVLHTCDTPSCVNPDHLFLGTHAGNMRDMVKKGRAITRRGESCTSAKITEDDVRAIRVAHTGGESQASLSRRYPLGAASIWRIVTRRTWGHIA